MTYRSHARLLALHLAALPFCDDLAAARPLLSDSEMIVAILDQAAAFAEGVLDPAGAVLDRLGVQVEASRVRASPAHHAAWTRFASDGWTTMALPEPSGQALPLPIVSACEELFCRGSAAFMMQPTAMRCAGALLAQGGPAEIADVWIPHLADGSWAATICISEPDAGSDVGRIRTRACRDDAGDWRISGEKCWISFGDHDLTPRIGHFLLARSTDGAGVQGISLFIVPNVDDSLTDNHVRLIRVEEKLGLHGSPTCVLAFEGARATLIGKEGRGLQALFPMMVLMRQSCGPQGVGVATAALSTALAYARERRQGGAPGAPPVAIDRHADVQRQLLAMAGRVEVSRGLHLAAAAALELSTADPDPAKREDWSAIAQFLLPLVKDGGARTAFDVASAAVQVLGGAGYTREWPVERLLRDARVFTVFEGTTGIQALDLLHRRIWRDEARGLRLFLTEARIDAARSADGAPLTAALDVLERTVATLRSWKDMPREAEAGAAHLLDLCILAAEGWIAVRLLTETAADAGAADLAASARFFLSELEARASSAATLATLGAARLDGFASLAGDILSEGVRAVA